jgi:hypothetical protein
MEHCMQVKSLSASGEWKHFMLMQGVGAVCGGGGGGGGGGVKIVLAYI